MTQEILAEAAVWLARLHGPGRSRAMQRECLAWQARSAAHRLAFERSTDIWQDVAGVRRSHIPDATADDQAHRKGAGMGWHMALAAAALGCAMTFALSLRPDGAYSTGVGEQRLIILDDGSRMTLNTSTDVRVKLTDGLRAVTVERGEALFEVAKDVDRPFIVSVSDANVVATGTAFLVRSMPPARTGADVFDVTLLEGQVIVQRSGGALQSALSTPVVMAPGDRLRVDQAINQTGHASPMGARLDRPKLDSLLGWKRGVAVLDDVTLIDAGVDMNRYSKVQITVTDSDVVRKLRVSGAYRTGDNEAFAQAVAQLHGLVVNVRDGGLELASK